MTTYVIDFTDPLKPTFTIAPSAFDGPGGAAANSSLRLYGRGALEWGESVDENLLRLLENYAGATAPLYGVEGQDWYATSLYFVESTNVNTLPSPTFYRYVSGVWSTFSVTQGLLAARPASSAVGTYYFATDTQQLFRWDSMFKQVQQAWLLRRYDRGTTAPTAAPSSQRLTWNGTQWTTPTVFTLPTRTADPLVINSVNAQAYFNTSTAKLRVFNGTTWASALLDDGSALTTNLDMGNNKIVNLGAPTAGTDAANKSYVDTADGLRVAKSGDTMTGVLTMGAQIDMGTTNKIVNLATPTSGTDATTKTYVDTADALKVSKAGDTMTGTLTLTPAVQTGTNDAATNGSVDSKIASALSGGGGGTGVSVINPSVPKDGDIQIQPGPIISVYAGGSWRQVWPAQYS